jgi:predicted ribosomally synthesized peptide with SipW-like signal peptide
MESTSRSRKMLLTLGVVGILGVLAVFGTFAAFTATTSNADNQITSGTVSLSDTDGGTGKLYFITDGAPNAQSQKCIRVTYGGTLGATVKLYRGAINASTGDKYTLRIERGTKTTAPDSTMSCGADFTAAADVYNGDLGGLGTDYAGGVDAKGSAWSTGNSVDYRFTVKVKDDATANAHTTNNDTGAHAITWEARNN